MANSFGDFLSLVRTSAPSPLATEATKLLSQGKSVWVKNLQDFWKAGLFEAPKENEGLSEPVVNPIHEFLARAYLQPYAEFIVSCDASAQPADDCLPLSSMQFPAFTGSAAS